MGKAFSLVGAGVANTAPCARRSPQRPLQSESADRIRRDGLRAGGEASGDVSATSTTVSPPAMNPRFCAASSKADYAAIERVVAEHGRDAFTPAWLADHELLWAADLIPDLINLETSS